MFAVTAYNESNRKFDKAVLLITHYTCFCSSSTTETITRCIGIKLGLIYYNNIITTKSFKSYRKTAVVPEIQSLPGTSESLPSVHCITSSLINHYITCTNTCKHCNMTTNLCNIQSKTFPIITSPGESDESLRQVSSRGRSNLCPSLSFPTAASPTLTHADTHFKAASRYSCTHTSLICASESAPVAVDYFFSRLFPCSIRKLKTSAVCMCVCVCVPVHVSVIITPSDDLNVVINEDMM